MARPSRACECSPGWSWASGSVSAGSDGEGVEVVGEDRPSGPDLHPVIAFEPGSAQPVAALEVTDPAFDGGPVSGSAFWSARSLARNCVHWFSPQSVGCPARVARACCAQTTGVGRGADRPTPVREPEVRRMPGAPRTSSGSPRPPRSDAPNRPSGTTDDPAGTTNKPTILKRPANRCFSRRVSEGTRTPDRLDHNPAERVRPSAEVLYSLGFDALTCSQFRSEWWRNWWRTQTRC